MKLVDKIKKEYGFLVGKRVLVAISGGIDSVCTALVMKELGAEVVLGHCNFCLRGEESNGDENWVRDFAKKNDFEIEVVRFDTKGYGKEHGMNTQLAARKLRYDWFEEVCQRLDIEWVIIGHHLNDNIETFLINLSRGTGLKGLVGIQRRNGRLVRPLSGVSREEIAEYMSERGQDWREDSSNLTDKYIRNKIRHHITPVLKELHPLFMKNFMETQDILRETHSFLEYEVGKYKEKVFEEGEIGIKIRTEEIKRHPNGVFLLYMMVRDYGFGNLPDIERLLFGGSGKVLFSEGYRLISNRDELLLTKREESVEYDEGEVLARLPKEVDMSKIEMPMRVRGKKEGDYFCPEGMGGMRKKLSKFFKDEKYSLPEKERQLLVVDAKDRIVWVVDKRLDERFLKK